MTRLEIREVSMDEVMEAGAFSEEESREYKKHDIKGHVYGGYRENGEAVFYGGIFLITSSTGEVWSKIMNPTYAMSSAWHIRDLIDYLSVRYDIHDIYASVKKDDPKARRWMEWLGMQYVTVRGHNGGLYDFYRWGVR